MLCQKCHKNLATVRYAEVIDGEVAEQQLCTACMALQQEESKPGFDLSAVTPTERMPSAERIAREARDALRETQRCPECGAPLQWIVNEGRVGCRGCYNAFGSHIESLLEGLHRSIQHNGKVTRVDDARARLRADLQTKRSLLRSVLKAENYEEAARLRDDIRSLESGLQVSESGAD